MTSIIYRSGCFVLAGIFRSRMARTIAFVAAIVTILSRGATYPTGAPTAACSTFTPIHGTTSPQSSPSPYELDLSQFAVASSFVYMPGQQYNITLQSSSSSIPFKGFLIQARSVYNTATMLGTFSILPKGTRYVSCSVSYPKASVTHNNTNREDYYSLTFTWTAPAANIKNGPLRFQFSVVQMYSTFWTEITSDIIQENTNGYLLLANVVDIKTLSLDGSSLKTLTSNPINVVDIDFHYRNNTLYWSDDTIIPKIKRSSLNGGNVVTIAQNNLLTPSSVAVDWINDKIYWSDEDASRIEVAELSGSNRKVLLDTDMLYPRDLVVDPNTRYIYWVDWGLGKIERASLDGTSREVIHSTSLMSPVGLTIDYQEQILYWIDSILNKMERSSVDGSSRQTLFTSTYVLNNAGQMTLLNNTLYWAEKQERIVYSTDINNPKNYQFLRSGLTYQPLAVEAVHPLRQAKASNPCNVNNGGCQQLCLLSASSSSGYSCACADGFLPATHDNSQCTAAPTYEVAFCLSGISNCNSWTVYNYRLEDAKMFKIAQAMVVGVRSLCTGCTNTFTSGNILSTQNSTLTCQTHDSNLVKYTGHIYGYSLIDNAPLLSAINQWTSTKPSISVLGDQLRVDSDERCSNSTSLISDVIAGISIAVISVFFIFIILCCFGCYLMYGCSCEDKQSSPELTSVKPVRQPVRQPVREPVREPVRKPVRQPVRQPVQHSVQLQSQRSEQREMIALKGIRYQEDSDGVKMAIQTDIIIDPVSRTAVQKETVLAEKGGAVALRQGIKAFKF